MAIWLRRNFRKMSADDLLLVTGSLYFVSQVRELLLTIGGNDEEI